MKKLKLINPKDEVVVCQELWERLGVMDDYVRQKLQLIESSDKLNARELTNIYKHFQGLEEDDLGPQVLRRTDTTAKLYWCMGDDDLDSSTEFFLE